MSSMFRSGPDKTQQIINRHPQARLVMIALLMVVIGVLVYQIYPALITHADLPLDTLTDAEQKAITQYEQAAQHVSPEEYPPAILIHKHNNDANGSWRITDKAGCIGINLNISKGDRGVAFLTLPEDSQLSSAAVLYNCPAGILFFSGNFAESDSSHSAYHTSHIFIAKYDDGGFNQEELENALRAFLTEEETEAESEAAS